MLALRTAFAPRQKRGNKKKRRRRRRDGNDDDDADPSSLQSRSSQVEAVDAGNAAAVVSANKVWNIPFCAPTYWRMYEEVAMTAPNGNDPEQQQRHHDHAKKQQGAVRLRECTERTRPCVLHAWQKMQQQNSCIVTGVAPPPLPESWPNRTAMQEFCFLVRQAPRLLAEGYISQATADEAEMTLVWYRLLFGMHDDDLRVNVEEGGDDDDGEEEGIAAVANAVDQHLLLKVPENAFVVVFQTLTRHGCAALFPLLLDGHLTGICEEEEEEGLQQQDDHDNDAYDAFCQDLLQDPCLLMNKMRHATRTNTKKEEEEEGDERPRKRGRHEEVAFPSDNDDDHKALPKLGVAYLVVAVVWERMCLEKKAQQEEEENKVHRGDSQDNEENRNNDGAAAIVPAAHCAAAAAALPPTAEELLTRLQEWRFYSELFQNPRLFHTAAAAYFIDVALLQADYCAAAAAEAGGADGQEDAVATRAAAILDLPPLPADGGAPGNLLTLARLLADRPNEFVLPAISQAAGGVFSVPALSGYLCQCVADRFTSVDDATATTTVGTLEHAKTFCGKLLRLWNLRHYMIKIHAQLPSIAKDQDDREQDEQVRRRREAFEVPTTLVAADTGLWYLKLGTVAHPILARIQADCFRLRPWYAVTVLRELEKPRPGAPHVLDLRTTRHGYRVIFRSLVRNHAAFDLPGVGNVIDSMRVSFLPFASDVGLDVFIDQWDALAVHARKMHYEMPATDPAHWTRGEYEYVTFHCHRMRCEMLVCKFALERGLRCFCAITPDWPVPDAAQQTFLGPSGQQGPTMPNDYRLEDGRFALVALLERGKEREPPVARDFLLNALPEDAVMEDVSGDEFFDAKEELESEPAGLAAATHHMLPPTAAATTTSTAASAASPTPALHHPGDYVNTTAEDSQDAGYDADAAEESQSQVHTDEEEVDPAVLAAPSGESATDANASAAARRKAERHVEWAAMPPPPVGVAQQPVDDGYVPDNAHEETEDEVMPRPQQRRRRHERDGGYQGDDSSVRHTEEDEDEEISEDTGTEDAEVAVAPPPSANDDLRLLPPPQQPQPPVDTHSLSGMSAADERTMEQDEDLGAASSDLEESDGQMHFPPDSDFAAGSSRLGSGDGQQPTGAGSLLDMIAASQQRDIDRSRLEARRRRRRQPVLDAASSHAMSSSSQPHPSSSLRRPSHGETYEDHEESSIVDQPSPSRFSSVASHDDREEDDEEDHDNDLPPSPDHEEDDDSDDDDDDTDTDDDDDDNIDGETGAALTSPARSEVSSRAYSSPDRSAASSHDPEDDEELEDEREEIEISSDDDDEPVEVEVVPSEEEEEEQEEMAGVGNGEDTMSETGSRHEDEVMDEASSMPIALDTEDDEKEEEEVEDAVEKYAVADDGDEEEGVMADSVDVVVDESMMEEVAAEEKEEEQIDTAADSPFAPSTAAPAPQAKPPPLRLGGAPAAATTFGSSPLALQSMLLFGAPPGTFDSSPMAKFGQQSISSPAPAKVKTVVPEQSEKIEAVGSDDPSGAAGPGASEELKSTNDTTCDEETVAEVVVEIPEDEKNTKKAEDPEMENVRNGAIDQATAVQDEFVLPPSEEEATGQAIPDKNEPQEPISSRPSTEMDQILEANQHEEKHADKESAEDMETLPGILSRQDDGYPESNVSIAGAGYASQRSMGLESGDEGAATVVDHAPDVPEDMGVDLVEGPADPVDDEEEKMPGQMASEPAEDDEGGTMGLVESAADVQDTKVDGVLQHGPDEPTELHHEVAKANGPPEESDRSLAKLRTGKPNMFAGLEPVPEDEEVVVPLPVEGSVPDGDKQLAEAGHEGRHIVANGEEDDAASAMSNQSDLEEDGEASVASAATFKTPTKKTAEKKDNEEAAVSSRRRGRKKVGRGSEHEDIGECDSIRSRTRSSRKKHNAAATPQHSDDDGDDSISHRLRSADKKRKPRGAATPRTPEDNDDDSISHRLRSSDKKPKPRAATTPQQSEDDDDDTISHRLRSADKKRKPEEPATPPRKSGDDSEQHDSDNDESTKSRTRSTRKKRKPEEPATPSRRSSRKKNADDSHKETPRRSSRVRKQKKLD